MSEPVVVFLNKYEVLMATQAAMMRHCSNVYAGIAGGNGLSDSDRRYDYHIRGALGELAVAKHFGVFWESAGDKGVVDMPGNIEVKTSDARKPRLIVQPGNRVDANYVLVYEKFPEYHILGWMPGADIKIPPRFGDHFQNGRKCYVARPEDLYPIKDLEIR